MRFPSFLLLVFFVLSFLESFSQVSFPSLDSANSSTSVESAFSKCGYDHSFRASQFVAPTTFLLGGSVITATPALHSNIDGGIRDWVQGFNPKRIYYDDYLQYAPLASTLILKACGLESEHGWRDFVCLASASCAFGFAMSTVMKHTCNVGRPGNPDELTSFPSGHTTTAFLGAELLRREYGKAYPAVAVAGYAFASGIACMRVWNNRHWFSDLLGGAGVAMLATTLSYWLAPKLRF